MMTEKNLRAMLTRHASLDICLRRLRPVEHLLAQQVVVTLPLLSMYTKVLEVSHVAGSYVLKGADFAAGATLS